MACVVHHYHHNDFLSVLAPCHLNFHSWKKLSIVSVKCHGRDIIHILQGGNDAQNIFHFQIINLHATNEKEAISVVSSFRSQSVAVYSRPSISLLKTRFSRNQNDDTMISIMNALHHHNHHHIIIITTSQIIIIIIIIMTMIMTMT